MIYLSVAGLPPTLVGTDHHSISVGTIMLTFSPVAHDNVFLKGTAVGTMFQITHHVCNPP